LVLVYTYRFGVHSELFGITAFSLSPRLTSAVQRTSLLRQTAKNESCSTMQSNV